MFGRSDGMLAGAALPFHAQFPWIEERWNVSLILSARGASPRNSTSLIPHGSK
jgi:hypothetical protein